MAMRRDEKPIQRKPRVADDIRRKVPRSANSHRDVRPGLNARENLLLGSREQAHIDEWNLEPKNPHDVDQNVISQILARRDEQVLLTPAGLEKLRERLRAFQKLRSLSQEHLARRRERDESAAPHLLLIKFNTHSLFESDEPVSQSLRGKIEHARGRAQTSGIRELDESADLFDRNGWKRSSHAGLWATCYTPRASLVIGQEARAASMTIRESTTIANSPCKSQSAIA